MGNVTALLLLVLFIGTIIGMQLFGDVCALCICDRSLLVIIAWCDSTQVPPRDVGPGISRHANFQSFFSGFLLLFRGLTGENIDVLARDCMRIHRLAEVYFLLFNDVVKNVFLNLYLATIIDKLDGAVNQRSRLFKEDFERFEEVPETSSASLSSCLHCFFLSVFFVFILPGLAATRSESNWLLGCVPHSTLFETITRASGWTR